MHGRVECSDQFERVGFLRAKLQRKRRLLLERVLRARNEILLVVGVNDVREEIPLVHRKSRPVVVRDSQCRGLEEQKRRVASGRSFALEQPEPRPVAVEQWSRVETNEKQSE